MSSQSQKPKNPRNLEVSNIIPGPIAVKKEKFKAENDESDIGSDFYNDSIFDDSDEDRRQASPPSTSPSPEDFPKKDCRFFTTTYCLQVYKDRKKVPSLQNTRTSMTLPNELLKIRTAYNSPLATQNNVSFGFSSGKSVNTEVSNSKLFTLPIRTKQLTRMFGLNFKSLKSPVILRGHEKMERLRSMCKKTVPKKYLEKYKKKESKKVEKAKRKLEKKEKERQAAVQQLVTDIIPKLDHNGVMKLLEYAKTLKKP